MKSIVLSPEHISLNINYQTKYVDSLDNFALDYSGKVPSLPKTKTRRVYQQGHNDVVYGDKTEYRKLPWKDGDDILNAIDDIVEAKVKRLNSSTSLDEYREQVKSEIDQVAEKARQRYITHGVGQSIAYQDKSEEAADYVAAGYPKINEKTGGYPFVMADAKALEITYQEAADLILRRKAQWISVGSKIEEHRLRGKKEVEASFTRSEINTAKDKAIRELEKI